MEDLKEKVLDAYQEGSSILYIIECFSITHDELRDILIGYKESNRYKRTFTDEFKKIIAMRDLRGVTRRQISLELELNANTVKKACEKFGQALKEVAASENTYTVIEGEFDSSICPSCGSKKVNEVDDNTIYCMSCGVESFEEDGKIHIVNWEYLD